MDIPTKEQLTEMWTQNPDGAGYAFVGKNGKVFYRKGFMTLDSLLEELKEPSKFKDTNFAIHFRIGTSGKNDARTCHPFPVSSCFGDLRKTEGKVDSVLFHNGVFSKGGLLSPLSSDTQDFVAAMTPMLYKYNESKTRDYFIEELVGASKVLVLYKNNRFKMYGKWQKDGELWVSNLYYKADYKWYGVHHATPNYDYYDDAYGYQYGSSSCSHSDIASGTANKDRRQKKIEEAEMLWAKIITNEYAFVTLAELQLLEDTCDKLWSGVMEHDSIEFGYDEEQMVVWVEETPPHVEGLAKDDLD